MFCSFHQPCRIMKLDKKSWCGFSSFQFHKNFPVGTLKQTKAWSTCRNKNQDRICFANYYYNGMWEILAIRSQLKFWRVQLSLQLFGLYIFSWKLKIQSQHKLLGTFKTPLPCNYISESLFDCSGFEQMI